MKNEDERKHRSKHHHIEKYHRHKIKHHHHHSHDYESLDGAQNNSSSLKLGNLDIINDGLFRIDTRNLGSASKKKFGTIQVGKAVNRGCQSPTNCTSQVFKADCIECVQEKARCNSCNVSAESFDYQDTPHVLVCGSPGHCQNDRPTPDGKRKSKKKLYPQTYQRKTETDKGAFLINAINETPPRTPRGKHRAHKAVNSCECNQEATYRRIISSGSRTNSQHIASNSSSSMLNQSNSSSSLNKSLKRISDRIFDRASFDNFSQQFGIAKRNGSLHNFQANTIPEANNSSPTSDNLSQQTKLDLNQIAKGILKFDENDFPDICTKCELCISQLKEAIFSRAKNQIKDKDIALEFAELLQTHILDFLSKREKPCDNSAQDQSKSKHRHHTIAEHPKFEEKLFNKMSDTRKQMLNVQKAARKFKFQSKEHRIHRGQMITRVSQLLVQIICGFMQKVMPDDQECNDHNHDHQDVRETSMIFQEPHYSGRRWSTDVPSNGFRLMMPLFFSYHITLHDQPCDSLEPPSVSEVERFIKMFMREMSLSTEVCLMSFMFIEKLIKKGKVQLLTINWRPIVYTAMLLATKYWEDYQQVQ